jgi:hypothetical protein
MGTYYKKSTATFQSLGWCGPQSTPKVPPECEYDVSRIDFDICTALYVVRAGNGRKWRRVVGLIACEYQDNPNPQAEYPDDIITRWVVKSVLVPERSFDTLKAAKQAVRDAVDGGHVCINNSTETDYLQRITYGDNFSLLHSGD